jgi:hypothetical protein
VPFSRCLSATGIRFLGIPVPPGNSAFLTVGLPNTTACPDPFGFSTFRTSQIRPGRAPPAPRDGGVHPAGRTSPVGACRFPAASPRPQQHDPSTGLK